MDRPSRKRDDVPDDTQMTAEDGTASLSAMSSRIAQFLQTTNDAPAPQSIEGDDGVTDAADAAIQMNLVLGVLEQQAALPNRDGILLPTPGTKAQMEDRDEDNAQAMVGILRALAGTPNSDDSSVAIDEDYSDSDEETVPG